MILPHFSLPLHLILLHIWPGILLLPPSFALPRNNGFHQQTMYAFGPSYLWSFCLKTRFPPDSQVTCSLTSLRSLFKCHFIRGLPWPLYKMTKISLQSISALFISPLLALFVYVAFIIDWHTYLLIGWYPPIEHKLHKSKDFVFISRPQDWRTLRTQHVTDM